MCLPVGIGEEVSGLFRHAGPIRLDGQSLCRMSLDHKQGLPIDHNPDDEDQNYESPFGGPVANWRAVSRGKLSVNGLQADHLFV